MIDEKKLIEELEKLKQEVNMPVDIVWNNLLKVCIDTVNEQPKVGEWIPCSERLPEKRDWYLAMFKETDTNFMGLPVIADYLMGKHTAYTTDDGWIIANCTDREDGSKEYYKKLKCVAWMPLPAPYNAERGGKNE